MACQIHIKLAGHPFLNEWLSLRGGELYAQFDQCPLNIFSLL